MKLSVVIVNYNVKYFLEQCLLSVQNALGNIEAEVFVVDNNSVDGSIDLLISKFPWVKIIPNKQNLGFSKANNQAINMSCGEYILLLNPDTVVEKDTFIKSIAFMDSHTDAGGLGVKMVDGKGHFLPESKRGLPTPAVAFYKIFGLSRLFPHSKRFGKYHLSYLDKDKIHSVEVLAGAFMLLRKSVLDIIGFLDEDFFMYGEDIDLSYRIQKAGYKNYYYPETRIIHYKGESTKKSSVNYVFVFYNAMLIFARKHFSKEKAKSFSFLIKCAIYFRASLSIIKRFLKRIFLPLIDSIVLFTGLLIITGYWEKFVKHAEDEYYPRDLIFFYLFPAYIIIILLSVFLNGGYDKPVKTTKIFRGVIIGSVFLLVIYALLPENMRFSRGITLLGALWSMVSMISIRFLFNTLKLYDFGFNSGKAKNFVIVGENNEATRVKELLIRSLRSTGEILIVNPENQNTKNYDGTIEQLEDIVRIFKVDEIVFCAKDISSELIIDTMAKLHHSEVDFKIAPPDTLYIIGSNSIHTSGELYAFDTSSINKPENVRNKRLFDIITSCIIFFFSPFLLPFQKKPAGLYQNLFKVFFMGYSWIGYNQRESINEIEKTKQLSVKKGILSPFEAYKSRNLNKEVRMRMLIMYARDYRIINDINIILTSIRDLGRKEK